MIIRNAGERAEFDAARMTKAMLAEGAQLFVGLNAFEPGQAHALHAHEGQDKLYAVLSGRGEVTVGDETGPISTGDVVIARSGVPHGLRNPGPARLVVLVVMAPPPRATR